MFGFVFCRIYEIVEDRQIYCHQTYFHLEFNFRTLQIRLKPFSYIQLQHMPQQAMLTFGIV